MQKLLLASENAGKIEEIQALLAGVDLELVTPGGMGWILAVEETGSTYGQNAALKARVYAQATHLLTMADDSGLEVQALGGLPGVHSRRFSPLPDATDADRRKLLLKSLQQHIQPWSARFRCVVAIASPQGTLHLAEGACPGVIIPEERGTGGFGYDPIFLLPELGRTMAELSMQEKNQVSHRARAMHAIRPLLEVYSATAG
jgi:XTP/dITP diphosphohydrolase